MPISGAEFIVLVIVAAVVLGPERLPQYAQQLGRLVRELRRIAQGASDQVRSELGPEFEDVDWRKLDPRQYDPRRIVREALSDAWDPDDPVGLKKAGLDRASLERDVDTLRKAGSGRTAAPNSAGAADSVPQQAPPAAAALPAFDEDAT